jgi:hypothetical protein
MKSLKHATCACFIVASMIGCDDGRASRTVDPWYREPGDRLILQRNVVPGANVHEVAADKVVDAEEALRDLSCIELSEERAADFAGQSVAVIEGKSYFLVRGVCMNCGTGRFEVAMVDGNLLVHHGTLGHSASGMKRRPLIVLLPHKPSEVYVSCSIAE